MTLPTLRMEEVPKPWRPVVSFMLFASAVITVALLFLGWVRANARAEARDEVRSVMASEIVAFKAAALEAARSAAAQAVREEVAPLIVEVRSHVAADSQAQRETDRRLEQVERSRSGWQDSRGGR